MMKNLGKKFAFTVLLAFGAINSAQSIVLDTFDYDVALVGSTSSGVTVSSGILSGVTNTDPAGDVVYSLTSTSTATVGAASGATLGAGELYLFNTNGTSNLTLNYFDEFDAPVNGIDLTDGGTSDLFYFDVEFIDLGFFLDLIVTDIFGNTSSLTFEQEDAIPLESPTERVYAAFADFVAGMTDRYAINLHKKIK